MCLGFGRVNLDNVFTDPTAPEFSLNYYDQDGSDKLHSGGEMSMCYDVNGDFKVRFEGMSHTSHSAYVCAVLYNRPHLCGRMFLVRWV